MTPHCHHLLRAPETRKTGRRAGLTIDSPPTSGDRSTRRRINVSRVSTWNLRRFPEYGKQRRPSADLPFRRGSPRVFVAHPCRHGLDSLIRVYPLLVKPAQTDKAAHGPPPEPVYAQRGCSPAGSRRQGRAVGGVRDPARAPAPRPRRAVDDRHGPARRGEDGAAGRIPTTGRGRRVGDGRSRDHENARLPFSDGATRPARAPSDGAQRAMEGPHEARRSRSPSAMLPRRAARASCPSSTRCSTFMRRISRRS